MHQLNFKIIFIAIVTVVVLITSIMVNITNVFAQTFQIDLQKGQETILGLYYEIKNIKSNVTGLEDSKIANSGMSFGSIKEDQVLINFKIKVPQEVGSKKFNVEEVNSLLKVTSIEEKTGDLQTYTLEPVPLSSSPSIIGGHKIINGYLDLRGDLATVYLNLES